jgi:hypothetical protein
VRNIVALLSTSDDYLAPFGPNTPTGQLVSASAQALTEQPVADAPEVGEGLAAGGPIWRELA